MRLSLTFALVSLLASACAEPTTTSAPPPAGGSPGGQSGVPVEQPGPNPPSQKPAPSEGLALSAPNGWVREEPTSNMRKAQFRLPKVEGDGEDASMVVYYFGAGQGGTVQMNIDRWCSQFEQPDGSDSKEAMHQSSRYVNDLGVTEIDLSGTFVAETFPGSGEHVNKPGYRMLAAIISSDHGPYFCKLTGPEKTVEHWSKSFTEYVSSAQ